MNRVIKVAFTILGYAFAAYMLIMVFIALPWFNYNYARENGFGKWLLLGEIVPTAKAIVWPYYAYERFINKNDRLELTEKEKKNLVYFIDSINLRNKAMNLFREIIPSDSFALENSKKIETILVMMKNSIDLSQKVNDQTLDKFYPDLSKHYREEFCEGLKIYINFLEKGELAKGKKAKDLDAKFGRWFANKFDLMSKRSKWFLNEFMKRQPD